MRMPLTFTVRIFYRKGMETKQIHSLLRQSGHTASWCIEQFQQGTLSIWFFRESLLMAKKTGQWYKAQFGARYQIRKPNKDQIAAAYTAVFLGD